MKVLFILLSLIASNSFCQTNQNVKFGDFDKELLNKTSFEIDSSADAIIIKESCNTSFFYDLKKYGGFCTKNVIHTTFKILKKSGLKYGDISISYNTCINGNNELISDINAITYNDTTIIELQKSKIINASLGENGKIQFSFPDVKIGSILEYEYTKIIPFCVSQNPLNWLFQTQIPIISSKFNIAVPSYFNYNIFLSGINKLNKNEEKTIMLNPGYIFSNNKNGEIKGTEYYFEMNNIEAFHTEPFMSGYRNFASSIRFELNQVLFPEGTLTNYAVNWPTIDNYFVESEFWGKNFIKNQNLSEIIETLKIEKSDKVKIKKAHDYMLNNFKWNQDTSVWILNKLDPVYASKIGNSTELNSIFVLLLRQLKIKADPVILSTRNYLKINFEHPQLGNFNNTISHVIVDKDTLLLDVTDPLIPFGSLPLNCMNEFGRLIKKNGNGEFIKIEANEKKYEYEKIEVSFDVETQQFHGNLNNSSSGYISYDRRSEIKNNGLDNFRKKFYSDTTIKIKNFKVDSLNILESPLKIDLNFTKKNNNSDSKYFEVAPFLFGKIEVNPFKKKERKYPIDFGSKSTFIKTIEFNVPNGYVIEKKPKNISVVLGKNGGKYSFIVDVKDKKISFVSRLILNKAIYTASEYQGLFDIYKTIELKNSELIKFLKTI